MAGNGGVFVNNTSTAVLSAIGLTPDLTFTSSSNNVAIYFSHKASGDEDLYFVSNGLHRPVEEVLGLREVGIPKIWDSLTGEITEICVASASGGRISISYNFNPPESTAWFSISKNPANKILAVVNIYNVNIKILAIIWI